MCIKKYAAKNEVKREIKCPISPQTKNPQYVQKACKIGQKVP